VSSSDYVLEGKTGFVVSAGDVTGLRAAVLRLWGDPGLRRRMGEEASRLAREKYTHDCWLERLLGLAAARLGPA
jgi:glycosyltransferase involved in cell wall biosynthesis